MGSNTGNVFQVDSTYRSSFYTSNDYDISLTRKQLLKITNKFQQNRTRNIAKNQLRIIKNAPRHLRTNPEFLNCVRNDLLVLRSYNDEVFKRTKKFPYSSALNSLLVRYIALEYEFFIAQKGDDETLLEVSNRLLCLLKMMLNDQNTFNEKKTKLHILNLLRTSLSEYKVNKIFCEEIMRKVVSSLNSLNSVKKICNKNVFANNVWFNGGLSSLLGQSDENYETDSDESLYDEQDQDQERTNSEIEITYAENIVFGSDLTSIKLNNSKSYLSHFKEELDDESYDTQLAFKTDLKINKIEKHSTNNNFERLTQTRRKKRNGLRMSSTNQLKIQNNLITHKTAKNNKFHDSSEIIIIDDDVEIPENNEIKETSLKCDGKIETITKNKDEKQTDTFETEKKLPLNSVLYENIKEKKHKSVDQLLIKPTCEEKFTDNDHDIIIAEIQNDSIKAVGFSGPDNASLLTNKYLNTNTVDNATKVLHDIATEESSEVFNDKEVNTYKQESINGAKYSINASYEEFIQPQTSFTESELSIVKNDVGKNTDTDKLDEFKSEKEHQIKFQSAIETIKKNSTVESIINNSQEIELTNKVLENLSCNDKNDECTNNVIVIDTEQTLLENISECQNETEIEVKSSQIIENIFDNTPNNFENLNNIGNVLSDSLLVEEKVSFYEDEKSEITIDSETIPNESIVEHKIVEIEGSIKSIQTNSSMELAEKCDNVLNLLPITSDKNTAKASILEYEILHIEETNKLDKNNSPKELCKKSDNVPDLPLIAVEEATLNESILKNKIAALSSLLTNKHLNSNTVDNATKVLHDNATEESSEVFNDKEVNTYKQESINEAKYSINASYEEFIQPQTSFTESELSIVKNDVGKNTDTDKLDEFKSEKEHQVKFQSAIETIKKNSTVESIINNSQEIELTNKVLENLSCNDKNDECTNNVIVIDTEQTLLENISECQNETEIEVKSSQIIENIFDNTPPNNFENLNNIGNVLSDSLLVEEKVSFYEDEKSEITIDSETIPNESIVEHKIVEIEGSIKSIQTNFSMELAEKCDNVLNLLPITSDKNTAKASILEYEILHIEETNKLDKNNSPKELCKKSDDVPDLPLIAVEEATLNESILKNKIAGEDILDQSGKCNDAAVLLPIILDKAININSTVESEQDTIEIKSELSEKQIPANHIGTTKNELDLKLVEINGIVHNSSNDETVDYEETIITTKASVNIVTSIDNKVNQKVDSVSKVLSENIVENDTSKTENNVSNIVQNSNLIELLDDAINDIITKSDANSNDTNVENNIVDIDNAINTDKFKCDTDSKDDNISSQTNDKTIQIDINVPSVESSELKFEPIQDLTTENKTSEIVNCSQKCGQPEIKIDSLLQVQSAPEVVDTATMNDDKESKIATVTDKKETSDIRLTKANAIVTIITEDASENESRKTRSSSRHINPTINNKLKDKRKSRIKPKRNSMLDKIVEQSDLVIDLSNTKEINKCDVIDTNKLKTATDNQSEVCDLQSDKTDNAGGDKCNVEIKEFDSFDKSNKISIEVHHSNENNVVSSNIMQNNNLIEHIHYASNDKISKFDVNSNDENVKNSTTSSTKQKVDLELIDDAIDNDKFKSDTNLKDGNISSQPDDKTIQFDINVLSVDSSELKFEPIQNLTTENESSEYDSQKSDQSEINIDTLLQVQSKHEVFHKDTTNDDKESKIAEVTDKKKISDKFSTKANAILTSNSEDASENESRKTRSSSRHTNRTINNLKNKRKSRTKPKKNSILGNKIVEQSDIVIDLSNSKEINKCDVINLPKLKTVTENQSEVLQSDKTGNVEDKCNVKTKESESFDKLNDISMEVNHSNENNLDINCVESKEKQLSSLDLLKIQPLIQSKLDSSNVSKNDKTIFSETEITESESINYKLQYIKNIAADSHSKSKKHLKETVKKQILKEKSDKISTVANKLDMNNFKDDTEIMKTRSKSRYNHSKIEKKSKDKAKSQMKAEGNSKVEEFDDFCIILPKESVYAIDTAPSEIKSYLKEGINTMNIEKNVDSAEAVKNELRDIKIESSIKPEAEIVNTKYIKPSEKEVMVQSDCNNTELTDILTDLKVSKNKTYSEEIKHQTISLLEPELKYQCVTTNKQTEVTLKISEEEKIKVKYDKHQRKDETSIKSNEESMLKGEEENETTKTISILKSNFRDRRKSRSKLNYSDDNVNDQTDVDVILKHVTFAKLVETIYLEEIVETVDNIDREYSDQILTESCKVGIVEKIIESEDTKDKIISMDNNEKGKPVEDDIQIDDVSLPSNSADIECVASIGNELINASTYGQCEISIREEEVFEGNSIDVIASEEVIAEEIVGYSEILDTAEEIVSKSENLYSEDITKGNQMNQTFIEDKQTSDDGKILKNYNTLDDFATIAIECGEINKKLNKEVIHQEMTNHSIDVILSNTDLTSEDKTPIKTKGELKSFTPREIFRPSTMTLRSKNSEEKIESSILRRFSNDGFNSGFEQQPQSVNLNTPVEVCSEPIIKIRKSLDDTQPLKSHKKQLAYKHFQNLKNETKSENAIEFSKISPKKRWANGIGLELELNEKKNALQLLEPVKSIDLAPIQEKLEEIEPLKTTSIPKSDRLEIDTGIKLKDKFKERQSRKKDAPEILIEKLDVSSKLCDKNSKYDEYTKKLTNSKLTENKKVTNTNKHRSESRSSVESIENGKDRSKSTKKYKSENNKNDVKNEKKSNNTYSKENEIKNKSSKIDLKEPKHDEIKKSNKKDDLGIKDEKSDKVKPSKSRGEKYDTKINGKIGIKDKKEKLTVNIIIENSKNRSKNIEENLDCVELKKKKRIEKEIKTKSDYSKNKEKLNKKSFKAIDDVNSSNKCKKIKEDSTKLEKDSDIKNKKCNVSDVMIMTTRSISKENQKLDSKKKKIVDIEKGNHIKSNGIPMEIYDLKKSKVKKESDFERKTKIDIEKENDIKLSDTKIEIHDLRKRKIVNLAKEFDIEDKYMNLKKPKMDQAKFETESSHKRKSSRKSDRKEIVTEAPIQKDDTNVMNTDKSIFKENVVKRINLQLQEVETINNIDVNVQIDVLSPNVEINGGIKDTVESVSQKVENNVDESKINNIDDLKINMGEQPSNVLTLQSDESCDFDVPKVKSKLSARRNRKKFKVAMSSSITTESVNIDNNLKSQNASKENVDSIESKQNNETLVVEENKLIPESDDTSENEKLKKDNVEMQLINNYSKADDSMVNLDENTSSALLKEDDQTTSTTSISTDIIKNCAINKVEIVADNTDLKSSMVLSQEVNKSVLNENDQCENIAVDIKNSTSKAIINSSKSHNCDEVSIVPSNKEDQFNPLCYEETVFTSKQSDGADKLNNSNEDFENPLPVISTDSAILKEDTIKCAIEESHDLSHSLREYYELQSLDLECTEVSITSELHPMQESEELNISNSEYIDYNKATTEDNNRKCQYSSKDSKLNNEKNEVITPPECDNEKDITKSAVEEDFKTSRIDQNKIIPAKDENKEIFCNSNEINNVKITIDNFKSAVISTLEVGENSENIDSSKPVVKNNYEDEAPKSVTKKLCVEPTSMSNESLEEKDKVDLSYKKDTKQNGNKCKTIIQRFDEQKVYENTISSSPNPSANIEIGILSEINDVQAENTLKIPSIKSKLKISENKSTCIDNLTNKSDLGIQTNQLIPSFNDSKENTKDKSNDIKIFNNKPMSEISFENELNNQTKNKKGGIKRSREVDINTIRKDKINKRPCNIEDIIKQLVDNKQIGIVNRTDEKKIQHKSISNFDQHDKDGNFSKLILDPNLTPERIDSVEVLVESKDINEQQCRIQSKLDILDKMCVIEKTELNGEISDIANISNADLRNKDHKKSDKSIEPITTIETTESKNIVSENKEPISTDYVSLSKNNEVYLLASIEKNANSDSIEVKILTNNYKEAKASVIIEELNDNLVDEIMPCNTANQLDLYTGNSSDCLISKKKSPNVIVEKLPQFNDQTAHSSGDTSILPLVPDVFESIVEPDISKSKDLSIPNNLLASELVPESIPNVLPANTNIAAVENQVLTSTVSLCNPLNTSSVSFVPNLHISGETDRQAIRSSIDTSDIDETPLCEKVRACGSIQLGTERIQDSEQVSGIGGPFLGGQVLKKSTKSLSKEESNKTDHKQHTDKNKCQFLMDDQLPELVFDCLIPSGSGDNIFVHDICKDDQVFDKVMTDEKLNEFLSNSLKDLNILTGVQQACKDASDSHECSSESILPEENSTSNESTVNSANDFAVDSLIKLQSSSNSNQSFPLANMGLADIDTISFSEELPEITWNQNVIFQKKCERWSPDTQLVNETIIDLKVLENLPSKTENKDIVIDTKEKPTNSETTTTEKKQKTKTKHAPTISKLRSGVTRKIETISLPTYKRTILTAPKSDRSQTSSVKSSTTPAPKSFLINDVLNMITPKSSRSQDLPILTSEVPIENNIDQINYVQKKSKKPSFVKTLILTEEVNSKLNKKRKRKADENTTKDVKLADSPKISSDDDDDGASTDEEIFKNTGNNHIMTTKQMSDLFDEVKKKNVNDLPFVRSKVYDGDKSSKKHKQEFVAKDSRNENKDKSDYTTEEPRSKTTDSKPIKIDPKKICYVNPIVRPTRQATSTRTTPVNNRASQRFSERSSERGDRSSERISERNLERISERNSERISERNSERISERNSERISERNSERIPERIPERSSSSRSNREIYQSDRYLRRSRSPSRSRRRNDPYYNDLFPPIRRSTHFNGAESNRGHYSNGSSNTSRQQRHVYFTEMIPWAHSPHSFSHFEGENHRPSSGRHQLFEKPSENREHNHSHYAASN